jgi:hypothetical protein
MDSSNDVGVMPHSATFPRHEEVQRLAFRLWLERGGPLGTPEVDWFRAEKVLRITDGEAELLSVAAKTIGSALGSLSAILTPDR